MDIIGLDIGTTSISAALINSDGLKVKRTFTAANRSFLETENKWERIQDPELVTEIATRLLDEILKETREVLVIGLTGQMHGIVYVDEQGKSVSPLYTWQDERGNLLEGGKSLCTEYIQKYGESFYSGYGLITHLYNLRHGLVPGNAARFCTIMDYLGMKLCGRKIPLVHTSDAASFGFFDIKSGAFREDLLLAEGADTSLLPEISSSLKLLGEYKGIPVSMAIGDNQASFFGSVKKADREILVNIGTGGQISVYTEEILTGKDIETRPFLEGGYLAVGASLCGGRAYALLAEFYKSLAEKMQVRDFEPYVMMDQLLKSYDRSDPLMVDTSFSGSRDFPDKRGSITNLSTVNFTPAALTYGVLDGIAQELYDRYRTMLDGRPKNHSRIVGSGNGMRKNPHLQSIMKKKFGMELELSDREEEAACGAALAGYITVTGSNWRKEMGL